MMGVAASPLNSIDYAAASNMLLSATRLSASRPPVTKTESFPAKILPGSITEASAEAGVKILCFHTEAKFQEGTS